MALLTKKELFWAVAVRCRRPGHYPAVRQEAGPVKVAEIKPGELRVVVNATTTSTVRSETEVTLSAQRTGRVVELPVREGDIVKAGP